MKAHLGIEGAHGQVSHVYLSCDPLRSLSLGVLDRETGQGELDAHFSKAAEHLERVVNELRPGYGFALYELGILHRVWQKGDDASDFLTRATEVNERYRDINDKAVERQLKRVADHDAKYT